jgi:hypothetical protein
VQELHQDFGVPVISIATLADLLKFLAGQPRSPRMARR